ncbi:TOMM precursor leader peptide-binding protein [Streptomyces hainanensis]|uniref:TOMM leader peptide-binding protein n=1 Tax=Streptomyces hainanensis TaxID=402648 RepID=A0A4R4TDR6_9ACTN|nr:TOMM precursor leader peptide-binding protein [Streptomyces hainanensis]TDC73724.1 TOMM precursor leader peptide-binding protein [Streptomyces hainanensis]
MATAFDGVAGIRPRIRRDVLFTRTPGGVLFHNADGGFHLTGKTAYRFASLIVPHLDGSRPLAEICAGLGEQQRAMVASLVGSLLERDFARDAEPAPDAGLPAAVAERFAEQIAYVDHYVDGAEARFRRFRETSVAVLGTGEVAEWCVLSLVRNGIAAVDAETATPSAEVEAWELAEADCPVRLGTVRDGNTAGYDVVVVAGADALARATRLLAAGLPADQLLIPAWTFGERAIVGPRAEAGRAGCPGCALLRFGTNLDPAAAVELWSELADGADAGARPAGGPLAGPVAAMIGNLLGYEIFRTATGALPAETDGQLLVQDLDSLDVTAEPLRPHPRCRRCATPAEPASVPQELAVSRTVTVESARDAEDLVAELNRISTALVRPYAGVFTRWDDEGLTQTPLKVSRVEAPLGAAGTRLVAAFDVHHLAGARQRGLRAAATAYVDHVVPAGTLPGGGHGGLPAVGPEALTVGGVGPVAAWSTAVSLLTKEETAVPAAALRPFGPHNRDLLVARSAAGAGAGDTPGEAAGHALLSALAHDALLRAVRGATVVRPVEPAEDDAESVFLHRTAGTLGVEVELLDLGEAARSGAHAVLARERGTAGARWAVGCDLSAGAAAVAALRDLLGAVQLEAETGESADVGDPLLGDLAPGAVAVTGPAVPAAPAVTFPAVLDRLRAAGRDALYAATTPADLRSAGLHTARVLLTTGSADAAR